MIGPKPAIQGNEAPNPDAALQNLFLTTCGVLKIYVSKAGGHQRLVPDGGVYDKACIHPHLLNRKSEDDFDRRGRRCGLSYSRCMLGRSILTVLKGVHPSSETQRTRETDVETKVVVEH